ncbi:MAG: hypothetical protein HY735_34310 [Verrucomicrobia bacterium]|nr:hypothetical protein [Verrucomicrobiota bacterium]
MADEHGKEWSEWLKLSWKGGYPGNFPLDDPRVFLFYFPPFPKKLWQEIDRDHRKRAALLLTPNLLLGGRLHAWLLLASKDFSEQIKAQEAIQTMCRAPMDKAALVASVRRQMEAHTLSPALIEKNEGIKRGLAGAVPPGFSYGKTPDGGFPGREEYRGW